MYYNNSSGVAEEPDDLVSRLAQLQVNESLRLDDTASSVSSKWKESYVASSSSQRRYLLPTDNNDLLNISINLSRIDDNYSTRSSEKLQSEKANYPQNLLKWTVNDSISETKINVANMKNDLNMLMRDEDAKRKEHNHRRGNLQEAWDKLVQLRTHISLFKSAIEEATIEDVALQAERGAWKPSNVDLKGNRVPLSADSAIRLGDVHGIREKIRVKESMQRKVAAIEELLRDLRAQLAHHSSELTRVNNTADRLLVSDSIGASMIMRQALISISQQLEDVEREYLTARNELELIEVDLTMVLERVRSNERMKHADLDKDKDESAGGYGGMGVTGNEMISDISAAMFDTIATVSSENLSNLVVAVMNGQDAMKEIALTVKNIPEGKMLNKNIRCEFSLHEVLSGYARVARLNGEEPKAYRDRLEKRLFALLILDQQLQEELLVKTEDVRRARDQLREVEVLRLRVELQVSNIESNLRQLLLENLPPPPAATRYDPSLSQALVPTETPHPHNGPQNGAQNNPNGVTPHTGGAIETPMKNQFQNEFALATGGYSTKKNDIPGSMYSPNVSPKNHPSTLQKSRDLSPSDSLVLSSHSQEYLYSVAQLQAHSGVKVPGVEISPARPRSSSMGGMGVSIGGARLGHNTEEPNVGRLQAAAKLLERDLAGRPREDSYSIDIDSDSRLGRIDGIDRIDTRFDPRNDSRTISRNGSGNDSRSSQKEYSYSAPTSRGSITQRYPGYKTGPPPKVPLMETYDGKSGRRLFSAPASVNKGVEEEKLGYSEGRDARDGRAGSALERARGLISRIESEVDRQDRQYSNTDEGYEHRNGGHEEYGSPMKESTRGLNSTTKPVRRNSSGNINPKLSTNTNNSSARYPDRFDAFSPTPGPYSGPNSNPYSGPNSNPKGTPWGGTGTYSPPTGGRGTRGSPRGTSPRGTNTQIPHPISQQIPQQIPQAIPHYVQHTSQAISQSNSQPVRYGSPKKQPPTRKLTDSPIFRNNILESPNQRENDINEKYYSYPSASQLKRSNSDGRKNEQSVSPTEQSLQKLAQCQAKLVEVLRSEIINQDTGIAIDRNGNSLGTVDILVISARNLPEMKKISHTADPYVELSIVSGGEGEGVDGDTEVTRTSVQWNNLFPLWRENLHLSPVEALTQSVLICVKDASKVGEPAVIGQCLLPLSRLVNQLSQTFWIPLQPRVETKKSARARPRFHDNCAVRIEAKLSYCKRILLQQKFDIMLEKLKTSSQKEGRGEGDGDGREGRVLKTSYSESSMDYYPVRGRDSRRNSQSLRPVEEEYRYNGNGVNGFNGGIGVNWGRGNGIRRSSSVVEPERRRSIDLSDGQGQGEKRRRASSAFMVVPEVIGAYSSQANAIAVRAAQQGKWKEDQRYDQTPAQRHARGKAEREREMREGRDGRDGREEQRGREEYRDQRGWEDSRGRDEQRGGGYRERGSPSNVNESQSPVQAVPHKKVLRIVGLRERQDAKMTATDLCRRTNERDLTSFSVKLPERIPDSHLNVANSFPTGKKHDKNEKKDRSDKSVASTVPFAESLKNNGSNGSEEREERYQDDGADLYGSSSQPDLTIFKSSRSRLAMQTKAKKR